MYKGFRGKNGGITLIALVVTIIILIILAGISISMLTGTNGILIQTEKAKDVTGEAQIIESARIDILGKQAENQGSISNEEITEVLETYGTLSGDVSEEGTTLTTTEGYIITVSEIWNGAIEKAGLPTANGTIPYLPSGEFTKVLGTNLDIGLIIEDDDGNQYVWIEVPNDGSGPDYTEVASNTDYTNIESALKKYTTKYDNTSYADTYYSDDTTGLTEIQYSNLKEIMLKSVYENGGFWIGRYEAGIEGSDKNASLVRTSHIDVTEASLSAVSQENCIPYTYVYCREAQTLASRVNSGNYTSSLMFGVQWDLVLKYLETKGVSETELKEDSTNWGNYYNATFTLNRGKYAQNGILNTWYNYTENLANCVAGTVKQSASASSNSILLTTGATDTTSKQNIYDLAGNVWEWTLEYANTNYPCVYRGGSLGSTGSYRPVSFRGPDVSNSSFISLGFRITLY